MTIGALLLFFGWIFLAFRLAQRRLNNAYIQYQGEEDK